MRNNQLETFNYAEAVTPDDANDIRPTNGIYIGGTGSLAVHMADDNRSLPVVVTFLAVQTGDTLNFGVKRILATGTSATGIVALYNRSK